jgi:hypothetical protein
VCIRFENSCCWARSASVIASTLSSSRSRPSSSVRSRTVTTAPRSRPSFATGIRLTTSTCSSVRTTASGPLSAPVSRSRIRPGATSSSSGRPTGSALKSINRLASSLTRVTRPSRSSVITPSRIPCSIASRSWKSAAISSSSRPNVVRLSGRASVTEATMPMPSALAKYSSESPATPLICAIESARGLLAAQEIADSVYARLDDDPGLREQAEFAHSLGFFGKSAIHPKQLPILHDVFTPSAEELTWAQTVLDAFHAAGRRGKAAGGRVRRPARRRPRRPPIAARPSPSGRPPPDRRPAPLPDTPRFDRTRPVWSS